MTTTTAREALTAAIATRTHLVQVASTLTGRKATAAWKAVEAADLEVDFAQRDVEMATRREMVGATEAEIQTAARAA